MLMGSLLAENVPQGKLAVVILFMLNLLTTPRHLMFIVSLLITHKLLTSIANLPTIPNPVITLNLPIVLR